MRNLLNLIGRNRDLQESVHRLRKENLKMRMDIEILIDFPEGSAARAVRSKYRESFNPQNNLTHDSKPGS
jgi:tRNA U34 5-carboxymethylaminomethyl modifying GTPase MnmE/TrmE